MSKQIAFIIFIVISCGLFTYTCLRLRSFFKLTQKSFPIDRLGERIKLTLMVAFGQTKIMRRPGVGLLHALVWWGFIVITLGTAEMVIDGLVDGERIFGALMGGLYDAIIGSGDIFAAIIIVACVAFLVIFLSVWLRLGIKEFLFVLIAIFLVWVAEAFNSVFEALTDMASPEFSERAKHAKDMAAAAVLITCAGSVLIGLLILGPPLYRRLLELF